MQDSNTGARVLLNTIAGKLPHPHSLPYDKDAAIAEVLPALEFVNPRHFDIETDNHQRMRARVRYLAALWPDATLQDLTHRIHGLLNNKNLTVEDLRLILQGRRLNDPSSLTREVSLAIIQAIGKALREGSSMRSIARELRVSYDTVCAVEELLGIRSSREDKLVDAAVDAAREGTSVRVFARTYGVSKSRAHRMLVKGQSVLKELGE
jgi:transposase-like protein